MTNITEGLFGHRKRRRELTSSPELVSDSMVGLEIELETIARIAEQKLDYWERVEDGSLRNNGSEYIFAEPLFGEDVVRALTELEVFVTSYNEAFKVPEDVLLDENTSVHVHVDCRDLSNTQLSSFIMLSVLLEQVLCTYAAPERENNIFSLSLAKANEEVTRIARILHYLSEVGDNYGGRRADQLSRVISDSSKYAGINLMALYEFGSIEFRMHKGEYRTERLLEWINILLSIKEAAKTEVFNEEHILSILDNYSYEGLIREVFKEKASNIISPSLERDIMLGVKLITEAITTKGVQDHRLAFEEVLEGSMMAKAGVSIGRSRSQREGIADVLPSNGENSTFSQYMEMQLQQRIAENMARAVSTDADTTRHPQVWYTHLTTSEGGE